MMYHTALPRDLLPDNPPLLSLRAKLFAQLVAWRFLKGLVAITLAILTGRAL